MTVDVEGYLRSKGLVLKPSSPIEIHTSCLWCNEPEEKRGRLYINIDPEGDPPGLFFCHLCSERGALQKLRKRLGDPPLRDEAPPEENDSYERNAVVQAATDFYHEALEDNIEALRYLIHDRGLSTETISRHQLGWADGTMGATLGKRFDKGLLISTGLVKESGHDSLMNCITIPYHVSGNAVQIRGRKLNGEPKYQTPSGNKARLFNSDLALSSDATEVVVCEGEFDAMVLEQIGFHAVGVPGAQSWQENWNGYFREAKRIYVVFDADEAGIRGAEKVTASIGPRSRTVRMPEIQEDGAKNDPTEWIVNKGHSSEDFWKLLHQSKGGVLLTVDDSYSEWTGLQSAEGLKLGIEMLDHHLKPGLLPAQLMLVLAKTGVGKTLLLLNLFHYMCTANDDLKILFISLEQTRGDWYERARRIYQFYHPHEKESNVLDFFRDKLYLVDKNRLSEEELIHCIEEFEMETGQKPGLIGLDYLGYWARSYKGEGYERTSAAVMALKAIAKDQRVPVIAPHQVSRLVKFGEEMEADAGRESGVVEETADFILGLWADDGRKGRVESEKTGVVNLKLLKSRHGGTGTTVHMQFAPLSLCMVPAGHPFVDQAREEHIWAQNMDTYERAAYRRGTGDKTTMSPSEEDMKSWRDSLG